MVRHDGLACMTASEGEWQVRSYPAPVQEERIMNLGSAADKTLVVATASAPWWLEHVNTVGAVIIISCGAVVGFCRAWLAIRDVIDRRKRS
jgi:hypothetical protein